MRFSCSEEAGPRGKADGAKLQCGVGRLAGRQPVHEIGGISGGKGVGHVEIGIIGVPEIHDDGMLLVIRRFLQYKVNMIAVHQIAAQVADALGGEFFLRVWV